MEIGKGHLPIGDEKKGGILSKRTKSSLSTENFVLLPDITLPPTTNYFSSTTHSIISDRNAH
jgi:hypothetical protein